MRNTGVKAFAVLAVLLMIVSPLTVAAGSIVGFSFDSDADSETTLTYVSNGNTIDLRFGSLENKGFNISQRDIIPIDGKYNITFELELVDGYAGAPLVAYSDGNSVNYASVVLDAVTDKYTVTINGLDPGQYTITVSNIGSTGLITYKATEGGKVYLTSESDPDASVSKTIHVSDKTIVGAIAVADPGYTFLYWANAAGDPIDTCYDKNGTAAGGWVFDNFSNKFTPSSSHSATYTAVFVRSDSPTITTLYMDNSQTTAANGYYFINFPGNNDPVRGQDGSFYDYNGTVRYFLGSGYRTGAGGTKDLDKNNPEDYLPNGYLPKTFATSDNVIGQVQFYGNNLVFWLMEFTGNKSDRNVEISYYALSDLQAAGVAKMGYDVTNGLIARERTYTINTNVTDIETMYVAEGIWEDGSIKERYDGQSRFKYVDFSSVEPLATSLFQNYNSSVDRQCFRVSFSDADMAKLAESALIIVINETNNITNIPLFISGDIGTYTVTVRDREGNEVYPYTEVSNNGMFPTEYGDYFVRTANKLAVQGDKYDTVYLLVGARDSNKNPDGYRVTVTATSGNTLKADDLVKGINYSGRSDAQNLTLDTAGTYSDTQWSFIVDTENYKTTKTTKFESGGGTVTAYVPSHFYYVKVVTGKSYGVSYSFTDPETFRNIGTTSEYHPEHSTVIVNGYPQSSEWAIPRGYLFGGWYDASTGSTYQPGDTFSLVSNVSLTAVCYAVDLDLEFIDSCTVEGNRITSTLDGSIDGKVTITQKYASTVKLPKIAAPDGWYFAGWHCTDDNGDHLIYDGYRVDHILLDASENNVPLYPKFEQKPTITIVGDSDSKVYDKNVHTVSSFKVYINGSLVDPIGGEYRKDVNGVEWSVTGISYSATGTNAGTYTGTFDNGIMVNSDSSVASDSDYSISVNPGSLIIERAPLDIITPSVSKIYDGTAVSMPDRMASVAGLFEGHALNYAYTYHGQVALGTYSNTLSMLKVMEGSVDVTDNYLISITPGLLEIRKGIVNITVEDSTVFYDGNSKIVNIMIEGDGFPEGMVTIYGIPVTKGLYGYNTSYVNAGTYVIPCDLSGIPAEIFSNYDISASAGTLIVEKRNIVIESGSKDGVITDGDTISNSTIIVKDNDVLCSPVDDVYSFVGGAKIGVTSDNIVLTEPNKVKDNTFSYTFIEGSDDNYIVECKYGKLSSFEPKMNTLVVYIDPTNSLIYNGKNQSHTNNNIKSLNTFIDSEPNVSVSGSGPGYSWRSCYGDDPAFNTDFTLNISVKWPGKNVGQYTCSASNVTVSLSDKTKVTMTSGADPNTFIGKVGNDDWYTIEIHTGILTINKAPLTIIADDKSISYGDDLSDYTYTVSGFVNGETYNKNVITGTPKFFSDYTVGSDVGTYPICIDVSGVSAKNYSISAVNGTLTVNKATPTIVTHVSDAIYGEALDPTSDVKIAGDLITDGISHQYSSDGINWGSAPTNAGDYYVRCVVNGSDNYNSAVGNPVGFSILRKEVTLALDNTSLEFNGSEQTVKASVTNRIGSDDVSLVCTGTTKAKDVGMYTATAVELTGADKDNYKLPDVNSPLTWNITKKAVTVKADNLAKIYGSDDPTLTATVSGLIGDDAVSYNLSREIGEDAGTYAIEASGATEQGNYSVSYVNGTFAITPASGMILTIHDYAGIYDGKSHEGTVTPSVTDGTAILYSLDGGMTWSETVPAVKDVSDSKTVKVKASNKNYADTLEYDLKLTVIKRNVTITSASETRDYNGEALTNDGIAVSGDGFVSGEGATYNVTGNRKDAGSAPNTFDYNLDDGTDADNYNIIKVEGTLTVTKVKLDKPTEDTTSRIYAETEYEYKPVGFDSTTMNIAGEKRINAGDHVVTVAIKDKGNYIVTYVPGTFTILRKDVTVEAMSAEKFFGDEDPVLSATVNGLVDDTVIEYVIVREAGEDAGKYAIHVSGEVQQGNYNVIFVDSVLDILGPNHVTIVVKMVDTSGEVIDVSAFNYKVGESVAIGLTAPEGYYLIQDTVFIDVTEAVVITVTCYTMEELIEILEGDADPDNSIIVDHANVRVDPKIHKFPWYIPLLVALLCIVLYWSIAYESEYAVTRKKF